MKAESIKSHAHAHATKVYTLVQVLHNNGAVVKQSFGHINIHANTKRNTPASESCSPRNLS